MRQLVCERFCKTAFGLKTKTKTNRHCCCLSVGSIQIKLKAQLVWMLAWCTVTQSELLYECVHKLKRRIGCDERFETVQCFLSEEDVVITVCSWRVRVQSGWLYLQSECLWYSSISSSVCLCECEQQDRGNGEWKHGETDTPRSSDRALRYPEVLVFFQWESTHWSWSSDRSSLWSGRRGLHWIQHWKGYCHL